MLDSIIACISYQFCLAGCAPSLLQGGWGLHPVTEACNLAAVTFIHSGPNLPLWHKPSSVVFRCASSLFKGGQGLHSVTGV